MLAEYSHFIHLCEHNTHSFVLYYAKYETELKAVPVEVAEVVAVEVVDVVVVVDVND